MITVCCDKCGCELQELGALAFSPPDENSNTKKYHFCVKCWALVLDFITRVYGGFQP